jgi:hypothetical protein
LIDFQLEVYEYFSKNETVFENLINNITKEEYFILSRFLTVKPFKIVECDKNVGSAIISHKAYDILCLKNLDCPDFEQINENPLDNYKKSLDILIKIFPSGHINIDIINNKLNKIYNQMGETQNANNFIVKSLNIPDNHSNISSSDYNLGLLHLC